ncbi:MAG: hypothetical protein INQ03_21120 [Candidatus Heimdallarchaeota archaeon]|nr:hypothetical protein [Candidatus Heimdallarchaeota archaeon]
MSTFDARYRVLTHDARTGLIELSSIIIAVLLGFVLPLPRFGNYSEDTREFTAVLDRMSDQVLIILLTTFLGIFLSYFYIWYVKETSTTSVITIHVLVFVNLVIDSIVLELAYFTNMAILTFLFLTILLIKIRPQHEKDTIFNATNIVLSISLVIIWYMKAETQQVGALEILLSQVIVVITLLLTSRYISNWIAFAIPMILNVILIPVTLRDSSFNSTFDVNLLLFTIFLTLAMMRAIKLKIKEFGFGIALSSTLLLQIHYLMSTAFSKNADSSIFHVALPMIDLSLFTVITILYLVLMFIIFISHKESAEMSNFIPILSFISIGFFIINALTQNYIVVFPMHHILLGLAILSLSAYNFYAIVNSKAILSYQILGFFLMAFIPNDLFSDLANDVYFITFVLVSLAVWYKKRDMQLMTEVVAGAVTITLILNIQILQHSAHSVSPGLLLVAILLLGLMVLKNSRFNEIRNLVILQFVSLYFLSSAKNSEYLGFSLIELGLVFILVQMIFIFFKFRTEDYILFVSAIPQSIITIFLLLTYVTRPESMPNEYILGGLLLFPSLMQLLRRQHKIESSYILVIQAIGLLVFNTVLNQISNQFWLLSVCYLAFIILGMVYWFLSKDDMQLKTLVSVSVLMMFYYTFSSLFSHAVPHPIILGLSILLLTSMIFISSQYQVILGTQAASLIAFSISRVSNESFTKVEIAGLEFIPLVSIFYIIFIALLAIKSMITPRDDLTYIPMTMTVLSSVYILLGLLSSNYDVTLINEVPPIILGAVSILAVLLSVRRKGENMIYTLSTALFNIYLLTFQANQIIIFNISSVTLIYLSISILMLQLIRKNTEENRVLMVLFLLFNSLLTISSLATNETSVALEFIVVMALMFSFIPKVFENPNEEIYSTLGQTAFIVVLLIFSGRMSYLLPSRLWATSFVFILYSIFLLMEMYKSNNSSNLLANMTSYSVLIILVSLKVDLVHPGIIGLSILSVSILQLRTKLRIIKEYVPYLQAVSLFFLLFNDVLSSNELVYSSIFVGIWIPAILIIWYISGTRNQLFSSIMSITGLLLISSLASNLTSEYLLNEYIQILGIAVVIATAVLYFAEISKLEERLLNRAFIFVLLTIISLNWMIQVIGSDQILWLRLILDWLIFTPFMALVAIYIRRSITQRIITENVSSEQFAMSVLKLLLCFIGSALLMGATGVYSLKLLAVAIIFWIFATEFINKLLSWGTSINTVLTLAFVLAQIPSEGGDTEIFYFIMLSSIGIVMTIAAVINEVRFSGEPFTSSLVITGGVFTAITIFAPLLRGNSFPVDLINPEAGDQIIYFLPNIVWALQGLGLFIFGLRYAKSYLRRFSLSILLVDILKTFIDIFSQDNYLIRIFGSIVLGSVLMLIFWLLTQKDEERPQIVT